jgi:hypothetical protein
MKRNENKGEEYEKNDYQGEGSEKKRSRKGK